MKIFSKMSTLYAMLFLFSFQGIPVYGFSPLTEIKEATQKVKHTVSKTADKVQDKVEDVGDDLRDAAKDAAQGVKKVAGKVADKVEDLGGDLSKNLQKLGFPDPKEFVKFAFSKMPKKAIKKLATELVDFALDVGDEAEKAVLPLLKTVDELYKPVPPLPTGIPLPLPSTPPGLSTAVNAAIGMSQSMAISRLQKEWLELLQAFHSATKYKYFSEKDRILFLKKVSVPPKKTKRSRIDKVGEKLQNSAKTARKPIEALLNLINKIEPKLFMDIEPLKSGIEPVPLMAFLPLGDSYNGSVFCFRIKQHTAHFEAIEWRLKNNLQPAPYRDVISLAELRKKIIMGAVLKIVEKNPIKNLAPIREMNDHVLVYLHQIPWGLHSKIILFLKILNLIDETLDSAISSIVASVLTAVTFGAAASVSEAAGSVIKEVVNADFVLEFIDSMFKWAYIRYLEDQFLYMDSLIARMLADGVTFDSALFKQELARIKAGQGPTNPIPGSIEDGAATPSPVKPMTKPLKIVIPVAKEEPVQKAPEKKEEPVQKSDVVEPVVVVKKEPALEKETALPSASDKLSGGEQTHSEPTALIDSAVQQIIETIAPETEKSDARFAREVSQGTEIETEVKSHRAKAKKVARKLKKRRKQQKARRRTKKAKKMIKKKNRHKKKNIKRHKKRRKNKLANDVVKFEQWLAGVNR